MHANIMMIVFTVVGVGSGIAVLRYQDAVARFFRATAGMMYPDKLTKKVYTARNFRWAGYGDIAFGLLAFGILVWRLFNGYGFK